MGIFSSVDKVINLLDLLLRHPLQQIILYGGYRRGCLYLQHGDSASTRSKPDISLSCRTVLGDDCGIHQAGDEQCTGC
ncbi:hypothetical protein D3C73_1321990 [compost metagenome]